MAFGGRRRFKNEELEETERGEIDLCPPHYYVYSLLVNVIPR